VTLRSGGEAVFILVAALVDAVVLAADAECPVRLGRAFAARSPAASTGAGSSGTRRRLPQPAPPIKLTHAECGPQPGILVVNSAESALPAPGDPEPAATCHRYARFIPYI
jgi:hypothetical protein